MKSSLRKSLKDEIGDFLVNEIKRETSRGKSPVEGESFSQLSKEYADDKKNGNRRPNLRLDGDLMQALDFKYTEGGVKVGIFEKDQEGKADGHNNFSGSSKLPTRRFIPDDSQIFNDKITKGINQIQNRYIEESKVEKRQTSTLIQQALAESSGALTTSDFLTASALDFLDGEI